MCCVVFLGRSEGLCYGLYSFYNQSSVVDHYYYGQNSLGSARGRRGPALWVSCDVVLLAPPGGGVPGMFHWDPGWRDYATVSCPGNTLGSPWMSWRERPGRGQTSGHPHLAQSVFNKLLWSNTTSKLCMKTSYAQTTKNHYAHLHLQQLLRI